MLAIVLACFVGQIPDKPAKLPKGFVRLELKDDTPEAIRKALEGTEEHRLKQIASLETKLTQLRKPAGKTRKNDKKPRVVTVDESPENKKKRVAAIESEIAELKRNPIRIKEFDKATLALEKIGRLRFPGKIITIPTSTSVIVRTSIRDSTKNPVSRSNEYFSLVLPTSEGFVDGQEFKLDGDWYISGTAKRGSSTIFKMEPIDVKIWIK